MNVRQRGHIKTEFCVLRFSQIVFALQAFSVAPAVCTFSVYPSVHDFIPNLTAGTLMINEHIYFKCHIDYVLRSTLPLGKAKSA